MLFSTRVAAQAALAILARFLVPTTTVSALSLQGRATTCNGHPEASGLSMGYSRARNADHFRSPAMLEVVQQRFVCRRSRFVRGGREQPCVLQCPFYNQTER